MNGSDGKWIGYGEGDESDAVIPIERRLLLAYPKNSRAIEHGVILDRKYTAATKASVIDITTFMNNDPGELERLQRMGIATPLRSDGVANLDVRKAIGAYVEAPANPPASKYPIQGVWADSRAFLNPPTAHSFVKATNDFRDEALRLYRPMVGTRIWLIGYSMGGDSVRKILEAMPPEWREYVLGVTTFGDPSMPDEGSLLGDDPGRGISGKPQPPWVWNRYWSYSIDGDWYPRARGLMFLLYQVLTRAELTMEFALYLFTEFPKQAFQQLLGAAPSDDPLAGVLRGLAGLMTTGPMNVFGTALNPLQLFAVLPDLVHLLFDAIKFVTTGAHGKYGDPAYALWDGMTAVDHAVATIRRVTPDGCTLFLFPGTWANWNQGFPFDVAARLQ
ncbi:putative peptidoglycan-binding domain-containing protein [Mycobacteroides abscessus subsp. abscessus]|uniref:cutinase n=1 Tax=Mycobacteroides abscessus TaxID=36809 RepID=UPI00092A2517|nr:cutinase [Mycobacteroides abscessus]SII09068.1 putative peptidoglycan-binding domain-containing protein [Mycobacteroides abscessus subsp. abscessus]